MGLRGKLEAKARGEVSTAALAAYSSATGEAYTLLDSVPPKGPARLAAWCAFVLQTHGDNLLGSGSAAGSASPEACEEAQMLFQLSGGWLARAHQAVASDSYRLDVVVPQPLPQPRAPRSERVLRAIRKTVETVQSRAGAELAANVDPGLAARLQPLMATVQAALDSAGALSAPSLDEQIKNTVGQTLQAGLDRAYQVGQLLAMPELLATAKPPEPAAAAPHDSTTVGLFLPGDAGFDPWCLTDPVERHRRLGDPALTAMLDKLWAADPDPAKTVAIQAQIAAALEQSLADYVPTGEGGPLAQLAGHCPWPGVLYTRAALTIGDKALGPGDRFVFTAGAGGEGFQRAIVTMPAARTAALAAADEAAALATEQARQQAAARERARHRRGTSFVDVMLGEAAITGGLDILLH